MEITLNGSIPHPQKKEPSNERECANDAAGMDTKDSSPEEQTESLLQSRSASSLCYCALRFVRRRKSTDALRHIISRHFWLAWHFCFCFGVACVFCFFRCTDLLLVFHVFVFSIVSFWSNKEIKPSCSGIIENSRRTIRDNWVLQGVRRPCTEYGLACTAPINQNVTRVEYHLSTSVKIYFCILPSSALRDRAQWTGRLLLV